MGEVRGHRERAALAVRRALVLVVTGCLLVSCGGGGTADRDAHRAPSASISPKRSGSPSAGSSAATTIPTPVPSTGDPGLPQTNDAAALAGQLDRAVATLRDPGATTGEVRQAAELQQLAVRALVRGSVAFRRTVVARLRPEAARDTRAQVRAARLLTVLTEPRRRFPPWHIIEPPPPDVLLGYYREAQRRTGVPWTYLAAIHLVETRMGRIRGPSTAGALGPMQFLPTTWARYGAGGDINDPQDAILAAARLLRANGAPGDMARALWHYNPSDKYVGAVAEYARTMQQSAAAYRGYWHWRVLCQLRRGTYVLPVGFPRVRPVPLPELVGRS